MTGYGALAVGGTGCLRGARAGVAGYAVEQTHLPGAHLIVTAVDWGSNGKELLGALGERLTRQGFVVGLGFGVQKTRTGAQFVWGIVIARVR